MADPQIRLYEAIVRKSGLKCVKAVHIFDICAPANILSESDIVRVRSKKEIETRSFIVAKVIFQIAVSDLVF